MSERGHLPRIEDPLVPDGAACANQIAPEVGDHEPIPIQQAGERQQHGLDREPSYFSLVWQQLSKSVPGMIGFVMVAALLFISLFADFFTRCIEQARGSPSRRPTVDWYVPDQGWRLTPVAFPITEDTDELRPGDLPASGRHRLRQPPADPLLCEGVGLEAVGLIR